MNGARFTTKGGDSLRELEETACWLELLVEGGIVPAAKLQPLRDECDELTAIFVTIIKRSRAQTGLAFFILHLSFFLLLSSPIRRSTSTPWTTGDWTGLPLP